MSYSEGTALMLFLSDHSLVKSAIKNWQAELLLAIKRRLVAFKDFFVAQPDKFAESNG
jgi:hypothetical protein